MSTQYNNNISFSLSLQAQPDIMTDYSSYEFTGCVDAVNVLSMECT